MDKSGPIGIFDSGIGGLSVMRHIQAILPMEDLIYLADQQHVPYGPRSAAEIREFSNAITNFLLSRGAKVIVVACNTASAAALSHLRAAFPETPFVGMEPAVKPGAALTNKGKIGILATAGTFGSARYAQLMARYAQGVVVYEDPCLGLVEEIEAGRLGGPAAEAILRQALTPMLANGVDTIILGCTHYPFVLPLIRQLAGPAVTIIDPAPAVACQVQRVLSQQNLLTDNPRPGAHQAFTSGDPAQFTANLDRLLNQRILTSQVVWGQAGLSLAT